MYIRIRNPTTMCVSPITTKNFNYMSRSRLAWLFKTDVSKIGVPCGHCYECRLASERVITQKCTMQGLHSVVYMATLTYDNCHLPSFTATNPATGDSVTIPCFNYSHIQNMIKRVRKYFPHRFKYLVCGERGDKKHRPHYHLLFFVERTPEMRNYLAQGRLGRVAYEAACRRLETELYDIVKKHWSVNVGTRKYPVYEPLFRHVTKYVNGKRYTNYDLHWVNPNDADNSHDSVYYYLAKYLVKNHSYEDNIYRFMLACHTPRELRKQFKSFRKCSRGLGAARLINNNGRADWSQTYAPDIANYILSNHLRKKDRFTFVDPVSGKVMPLSRAYMRIIPIEDYRARYDYLEAHPELKKDEFAHAELTGDHFNSTETKLRKIQIQLHNASALDAVIDSDESFVAGDFFDMPDEIFRGKA